jgi:hypothetical protein
MIENVTIREMMPSTKPGTVKFKTTDNRTFNCNKDEIIHLFAQGERYHIDYNETTFDGRNGPVTMKWVNRARNWQTDDGPNTYPDKDPYQGKGGGSYSGNSGGGSKVKDNYDPEVSKIQTRINAAAQVYGMTHEGLGLDLDEFSVQFPVIMEIMEKAFQPKPLVPMVDEHGNPSVPGDEDISF